MALNDACAHCIERLVVTNNGAGGQNLYSDFTIGFLTDRFGPFLSDAVFVISGVDVDLELPFLFRKSTAGREDQRCCEAKPETLGIKLH